MANYINFETDKKKNSNTVYNDPNFYKTDFQRRSFEEMKAEWRK